jgi:alkylated DNA repair protein alkB family protein 6
LLITTGEMYTDYLHGIEEITIDEDLNGKTVVNWPLLSNPDRWMGKIERQTRTSLTFRDVLKVVKIKL